jgi:CheY-like chemotaxis protein
MSMSVEPVHLGSALADALSLIGPIALKAEVQLTANPALADVYVMADSNRLKQVLVNVLSNAVKYNRPGGEVSARCTETPGGRVELAIADTGRGISPAALERLFEPFDRLGAERTDVEGTGLGLALSMHLMQAMGGAIRAESTPDAGTTMRMEFLGAQSGEAAATPAEQAGAVNGSIRATVVYIEDNPSNVMLVERALARLEGVRLISSMQGGLGLDLIREHDPDLILLDLHLPDMAGHELLALLKSEPATARIPVFVLSADATPSQVERLQAAGAAAYMTKPIDVARLLSAVESTLPAPAAHSRSEDPHHGASGKRAVSSSA